MNLHRPHIKLMSAAAIVTSAFLLGLSIVTAYILLHPIDVINEWTITYDKPEYTAGETAIITSKFTQVKDISGKATRYLECKTPSNTTIRYQLNEAAANSQKGARGVGIIVQLPDQITGVTLPTECKFSISIDYQINKLRNFNEANESTEFTLNPKKDGRTSTNSTTINNDGTTTTTSTQSTQSTAPTSPSNPNAAADPPTSSQPPEDFNIPIVPEGIENIVGL